MRLPAMLREHPLLRVGLALLVPGLMVLVDMLFVWWSPIWVFGFEELPDVILASYGTWAILGPLVVRGSQARALWLGIGSPFLGAFILLLLWALLPGPLAYERGLWGHVHGLAGGMMYAVISIVRTAPFTLLVGIVTALLLRWLLSGRGGVESGEDE